MTTALADTAPIRDAHGGTVNDVILATRHRCAARLADDPCRVAGRAAPGPGRGAGVGHDHELEATSLGTQIAPHFVDLPIGEPSPVVRLHQVSYSFKAHKETGRAVAANRLAGIAGFAPSTFHAIGVARRRRDAAAASSSRHQRARPAVAALRRRRRDGAAPIPVPPLLPGQALAIGVTSYDGPVFYGITADRDLVPDADVLRPVCLGEALDELLDTAAGGRPKVPRGRRRKTGAEAEWHAVRVYLAATLDEPGRSSTTTGSIGVGRRRGGGRGRHRGRRSTTR